VWTVFTRPPFLPLISTLAALAVASFIVVTPVDDDFWLYHLGSLTYGVHVLRRTEGFARSHFDSSGCEIPFAHVIAWRMIAAHPAGDSLFRHIFARGRSGGRLYALIGLYRLRAQGLQAALRRAHQDTALVFVWDWDTHRTAEVSVKVYANEDSLRTLSRLLEAAPPPKGCAA